MYACLLALALPPKVSFRDGVFTVSDAGATVQVPAARNLPHDAAKGTFETAASGLTVRFGPNGLEAGRGGQLRRLSLAAFVASPKLLSAEEIRAVAGALRRGERSAEPAMLCGYETVGSRTFLLLRWQKPKGDPWMEAVAYVDAAETSPRVAALGRLAGLSFAKPKADDRLHLWNGKLAAATNSGGRVGIATIGLDGANGAFQEFGPAAGGCAWSPGLTAAVVTRPLEGGWSYAELVSVESGQRIAAREFRGQVADLLPEGWAKLALESGPVLANLATGAEVRLAPNTGIAHTALGLLAWSPASRPQSATLYDANCRSQAAWKAGE